MSFTDNFGHPKGFLGRMMLVSMDKEHRPLAEWGLKQFKIPAKAKVLDIGCGGGYNIQRMLNISPDIKVVGYDISLESVRVARSVNRDDERVKIVQGSVEKMPFSEKAFDLVTAFETVFFWPDTENNISEVLRVVKPGGRFVVVSNFGNPDIDWEKKVPCMTRYTAEQISGFMAKAGFVSIHVFKKDNYYCVEGAVKL